VPQRAVARPRLAARRAAGSRQEILAATRTVLARVGPAALRVEQVAAELGVTKQALYHYYPSKEAVLFEVAIDELVAAAEAVNRAALAAPDGAGALEAIVRTYTAHFLPNLEMHRLVTMFVPTPEAFRTSPEVLARIRPINDLMYGAAEAKLAADRKPTKHDPRAPRRLAFTAHLAALGFLTMRAITDSMKDPLLYSDAELVDELVRTYRAAAAKPEKKETTR
jgi:AcrR family transcriptional regulator